ncbi:MAG: DNA repair protein RecO C-terminal domain-containing protein [Muribaculaceae bacterium]|nr:DNA repair protein RecO C-terminal domain-containing protein [Muribaculaceae bacterium]
MDRTLTLIPLRVVKYSDRHSILTAYSRERGTVAMLVPAGTGREAARVRALTSPLSIVECVAKSRPGRDIMIMTAPRPVKVMNRILADPDRRMTAQFLAELLTVVLHEGAPDEVAFRFLTESIEALDSTPSPANFHLAFLYGLARVAGIAPDVEGYRPGMLFDMVDGVFRLTPPLHGIFLEADSARVVERLSRMTYANMARYRFTRAQRNDTLDAILNYFTLHYTSLRNLHSLAVLRSLI